MTKTKTQDTLKLIYERLYKHFGPQHWWPGETPFEVIVGAILTQNTAWSNVEKAISNLKSNNLLTPKALKHVPLSRLAKLIRPSGYYNQKTAKLKNFVDFLFDNYGGSLEEMFNEDYLLLRAKLLKINGIGLETADSILLYAASKPLFVVDAYTKRVLTRHNLVQADAGYTEIQNYFMDSLAPETKLFNEFHALIVRLGKDVCKTKPDCPNCPLRDIDKILSCSCDSCGRQLPRPQGRFIVEIKLYASPEMEITKEELEKDSRKEYERLLKELKHMDTRKLEEEVFVAYKLTLCKKCRDTFNSRIQHKEFV